MSVLGRIKIRGISDDSRTCRKGDIFFAIHGSKFDGRKFIEEAVRKGAAIVVAGKGFKTASDGVRVIRVASPRAELARAASDFYGRPSRKLKVIGVTGTNGKTTVTYLLRDIFKKAGVEAGIIGTIAHRWKNKSIEAKNTTPGALQLQGLLGRMHSDGVEYCMMEVSSHALDQQRVFAVDFRAAIFTNITAEHLDYHKTFTKYLEAKAKLFRALQPRSAAILNADDMNSKKIKQGVSAKVITYGIQNKADVWADDIKTRPDSTQFIIRSPWDSLKIESPLIGRFNVYNILAGVCAAMHEEIPVSAIQEAVMDFKGAEGRLDPAGAPGDFKVFVDYAHTDDALRNVLEALRPATSGRLIVVFGCGGDRDRTKRPRMGDVTSRLADFAVITSDNPRSESPEAIAKEIVKGIDKRSDNYKVVLDRKEAIREALSMAQVGDVILIAGKGHERCQIIGNKTLAFSDREAVEQILAERQCLVKT